MARDVLNDRLMWIVAPLLCLVAIIVSFLPDPRERPAVEPLRPTTRWSWGLPVVATALVIAMIVGAVS